MARKHAKPAFTAKMAAFVVEYPVDKNATQAAIRAGYSAHSAADIGRELLKKPEVMARIQEELDARAERTRTTADDVIAELVHNAKFAQRTGDYSASNRALELIGKHNGMFSDKLKIDFTEVAKLSDEDLAKRREELGLTGP